MLDIYRLNDQLHGNSLTVKFALILNGICLLKAQETFARSPWSPELDWPADMVTLASGLEKALNVTCVYHDLRKPESKPTSLTMPGIKLRT